MDRTSKTVIKAMLDAIKAEHFVNASGVTDAQAMGILLSQYSGFDGVFILRAAESGLEDANFHTDSAAVAAMADKYEQAADDDPIDADTRKAVFAALREHYGRNLTRTDRLAKLSAIVGHPVTSLSDRYCNMTNADARRFFDVLKAVAS